MKVQRTKSNNLYVESYPIIKEQAAEGPKFVEHVTYESISDWHGVTHMDDVYLVRAYFDITL